jgi:hypothetical protein
MELGLSTTAHQGILDGTCVYHIPALTNGASPQARLDWNGGPGAGRAFRGKPSGKISTPRLAFNGWLAVYLSIYQCPAVVAWNLQCSSCRTAIGEAREARSLA